MSTHPRTIPIRGIEGTAGLGLHSYSRAASKADGPNLGENPLNLFTLAYSDFIEAIAETFFPPNEVVSAKGRRHLLRASDARIDRHVHFRSAWEPAFGVRLQLALRDLGEACIQRHAGRHFAALTEPERAAILQDLQREALPPSQWTTLRKQREAFEAIYEAVSCGLTAEPGYGGNAGGIGWFYTGFMTIAD